LIFDVKEIAGQFLP